MKHESDKDYNILLGYKSQSTDEATWNLLKLLFALGVSRIMPFILRANESYSLLKRRTPEWNRLTVNAPDTIDRAWTGNIKIRLQMTHNPGTFKYTWSIKQILLVHFNVWRLSSMLMSGRDCWEVGLPCVRDEWHGKLQPRSENKVGKHEPRNQTAHSLPLPLSISSGKSSLATDSSLKSTEPTTRGWSWSLHLCWKCRDFLRQ